jgi:hypothetical protein
VQTETLDFFSAPSSSGATRIAPVLLSPTRPASAAANAPKNASATMKEVRFPEFTLTA